MKIKRQKKVQKILDFYKHNFGHFPPYQMLLDATFVKVCLEMQINIKEQMPKYIGQEVKILTTKCVIMESEKLGAITFGATKILKQFPLHKCGHEDEPIPAWKCLRTMVQNNNAQRYFIVTQDEGLREKVRKIPGTPALYLHFKALTLEKPSESSNQSVQNNTNEKIGINQYQATMIARLKQEAGISEQAMTTKRKRKKKGGPNPLSCLKKKSNSSANDHLKHVNEKLESAGKKKTRRKNKKRADAGAA